jgi:hypothetical protein
MRIVPPYRGVGADAAVFDAGVVLEVVDVVAAAGVVTAVVSGALFAAEAQPISRTHISRIASRKNNLLKFLPPR